MNKKTENQIWKWVEEAINLIPSKKIANVEKQKKYVLNKILKDKQITKDMVNLAVETLCDEFGYIKF